MNLSRTREAPAPVVAPVPDVALLEDAVLAAAALLGQPGRAEPISDPTYRAFLQAGFWGTVAELRERRG